MLGESVENSAAMGVGLQPLEFTECLTDSPQFRENLQKHEKELENTSQQIKRLIREVKDIVQAAKRLSSAQLALARSMEEIEFTCVGASMTDDERAISKSLTRFAEMMRIVEEERGRMLGNAYEQIIQPLEKFRKDHIGDVKEGKKKFDKKTAKFTQTQERTLALSHKKHENDKIREADAAMDMAERDWCQASLEYVFLLQAVQERKKFELVETLLCFVFGWWTFYHQAHEVHREAEPDVRDLQLRIQRTRSNFEETSRQTESLMRKMMEVRQTNKEDESGVAAGSRSGYVMLQERKAFGNAWCKHYAAYDALSHTLRLVPLAGQELVLNVTSARLCSEPVERRFCWEVQCRDRATLVLQAPSHAERAAWLRALTAPGEPRHTPPEPETTPDEAGFAFVRACIAEVEARGLGEQGLYRVAGVASRAQRLVADRERRLEGQETRTITSALKGYLRSLPEPLLTTRLHAEFVAAAKLEPGDRLVAVSALVRLLPESNRAMLDLVLSHLRAVAAHCADNLMSPSNLAVCFGPTLLRPPRETVASILDLKFCNVLVETLLEHWPVILEG